MISDHIVVIMSFLQYTGTNAKTTIVLFPLSCIAAAPSLHGFVGPVLVGSAKVRGQLMGVLLVMIGAMVHTRIEIVVMSYQDIVVLASV